MELQQFFIILYLVVLVILSSVNPRIALLFFFTTKFTLDIFWDSAVIDGLNILKITGVLFPLFCTLYVITKRHWIDEHPFGKTLIILFGLNCLASLWGLLNSHFLLLPLPHSPLTLKHVLDWNFRFLNIASVFLIVPYILSGSVDRIIFLKAFLISTIIPCLISWYQLSSSSINQLVTKVSEPYSVSSFQRLDATYHDPGTLSLVMFTGIILSVFLLVNEKARSIKIIYGLYALLCSIILYFTFSRTLWISITLFLVAFFIFQQKYKILLAVIIIAVSVFTLIPLTQKRFERELTWIDRGEILSNPTEIQKLGTGRIWLWNDARKHFLKLDIISKLIGSGGSFGSHNQYIAWLLRNGILGLAVWLFFLYKMGAFLWLKFKEDSGEPTAGFVFVLFFIVIGVTNIFMQPWDNTTFAYFFWSLIGIYLFQESKAFNINAAECV